MKIDFVYPQLPPAFDAIGESTALLAQAMSVSAEIRILCGDASAVTAIPEVQILSAIGGTLPRAVNGLVQAVRNSPPDWILLPYNPFAYGPRGWNPWLPRAIHQVKRQVPGVRVGLLAHEAFSPPGRLLATAMSLFQRVQFFALGRSADLVLLSTEPWADRFRSWFPGTPVEMFPIGSNLPRTESARSQVRERLGIGSSEIAFVTFGAMGGIRDQNLLAAAFAPISGQPTVAVYVGPAGDEFRRLCEKAGIRSIVLYRPDGARAAEAINAADIALAPFTDGVSARRTSFLSGLQQGVASVTTEGPLTGPALRGAADAGCIAMVASRDKAAFVSRVVSLATDRAERVELARKGAEYYAAEHEWPVVARRMFDLLDRVAVPVSS